jgi:hypothetical protein
MIWRSILASGGALMRAYLVVVDETGEADVALR